MIEQIGGRKALISLLATGVAVAITVIKGDVPQGLKDMLQFILGAFIAGNVGSKVVAAAETRATVTEAVKAVEAEPPAEPIPSGPPPVTNEQLMAGLQEGYGIILQAQKELSTKIEGSNQPVIEALAVQQNSLNKLIETLTRRV